MRLREYCYTHGLLRTTRLSAPVISVGNLTMGGSGKTPLVQYLARLLLREGLRPAVISRGYGGAAREPVNVVSDGHELFLDAAAVGDEPRLLAETLASVPVLTGVVRRLPAARALEMGADVLLLDDGFQHLALARDLDLVLFHSDILAGNSRVFPGGVLREPVAALHRCHGFVMTNTGRTNRERAHRFADLLRSRFPGKPVFFTGFVPQSLVEPTEQGLVEHDLTRLRTFAWFAFCGTAHPDGFKNTLAGLGLDLKGFQSFGDHFAYRQQHLDRLAADAGKAGAAALITTEKDLVKLRAFKSGLPLRGLRMDVQAEPDFDNFVLEHI